MKAIEIKSWLRTHSFSFIQIIAVISGLICGFILKYTVDISPLAMTYLHLPGKLMIRYCSMFIVPLIVVALASSLATVKREGKNKNLISYTITLIICLSIFISIFGLIMVTIVNPGKGGGFKNDINAKTSQKTRSIEDSLFDIIMNLVPDNIISATFMMEYTALVPKNPLNISEGYKKERDRSYKTNILGLCVFSLILGFILLDLGEKVQTIKKLLEETNILIMRVLKSFIVIMPIGMFFWMMETALQMKSITAVLYNILWFTFTAIICFVVLWVLVYPGIFFFALRKNPFKFYLNIIPALIVAFGSESSAITLPVTMKSMEENYKLSKTVSNFVLPLAMNMHMPGTSVYYPMIVMFVAQMYDIHVSLMSMVPMAIYVIILVMALPAAGGGGLVFFVMACDMIGVDNPMQVLIYCIYIDWIMDKIRTCTNVMGDCIIAAIIQKYCHFEDEGEEEVEDNNLMEVVSEA